MTPMVMTIVGTRPEAIKMMPVIRMLRRDPRLLLISVATGQHDEMLDQVFATFGERPDVNLSIMTANQTLAGLTATVLTRMMEVYSQFRPDLVLVHGDTTTAMAAGMAAFYAGIRLGHVEAGLRTANLRQPWPEEFNRVVIDSVSELLFAPTAEAQENLLNEYNRRGRIVVSGNTGIDALFLGCEILDTDAARHEEIAGRYSYLGNHRLILVTGHRRESFGEGFQRLCDALLSLAEQGRVQIVYPVHLNPNVREVVHARLVGRPNIHLIEPVDYLEMIWLMRRSHFIITDSGGIQEEAPALGKPVLVTRERTERPEALRTGVVQLVGTDPQRIVSAARGLLDDPAAYAVRAQRVFPYGDGHAAERISRALVEELL
jgi:UDP-N-acetylglucosamine 2-epimerase